MLTALLLWVYISIITWSVSLLFIKIFSFKFKTSDLSSLQTLPLVLFSGLLFLIMSLGYFSLFFRINWEIHFVILITALIFLLKNFEFNKNLFYNYLKQFSKLSLYKKVILLFLFFAVLFFAPAISKQTIVDNGLYYAQTVKWIENYPVVPGLGDLHGRYAFNSHWFLGNAFFSLSFLQGPYTLLNVWVFLLFCSYLIIRLPDRFEVPWQELDILRSLVFIAGFFLLKNALNSVYPDLAVTLFCWLLCLLWLEKGKNKFDLFFMFVLAVSLLTIKLSAWPVLIFIGLMLKESNKNISMSRYLFLAILIIFPWLARNIILSGYLVYPLPEVDIFNLDWKIPLSLAFAEKNAVIAWARVPYAEVSSVMQLSLFFWFSRWLAGLSMIKKSMLAVLSAGSLCWGVFILTHFKEVCNLYKKNPLYFQTAVICFVGIIYWFFSAPDFRFGYNFILIYCLLLLLPLLRLIRNKFMIFPKAMIGLIFLQICLFILGGIKNNDVLECLVFPAGYPQAELKVTKVQARSVYVPPDGQLVWDAPLPAAPFVNDGLEFRGSTLKQGFRIKKAGE